MPYPRSYQPALLHWVTIENGDKKYTFNTAQVVTEALARWILRVKTGAVSGVVSQQEGVLYTFADGRLLAQG